jgi:hypothetical protein
VAFSVVDTHIQNPARAGGRKKMAKARRKMSAKQIKHFGTKRQKAALRAKRSAPKHRARTKPNPPRRRRVVAQPKRRRRSVAKKSTVKRRKNPTPMIISWAAGNPAKRRTSVAKRKTRKRATAKRSNAGRRRTVKKMTHRRRRNPGTLGSPMNWIEGGAGVIAGVVGARTLPQMLLGASNTGPMGYAANAAASLGLGFLAQMFFKKPVITAAVIAGGFATTLSRIISDKTPFGAQLSLTGLGDYGLGLYQKSNYPYPPHLVDGRGPNSSMFTWGDGSQGSVGAMAATLGSPADSTGAC